MPTIPYTPTPRLPSVSGSAGGDAFDAVRKGLKFADEIKDRKAKGKAQKALSKLLAKQGKWDVAHYRKIAAINPQLAQTLSGIHTELGEMNRDDRKLYLETVDKTVENFGMVAQGALNVPVPQRADWVMNQMSEQLKDPVMGPAIWGAIKNVGMSGWTDAALHAAMGTATGIKEWNDIVLKGKMHEQEKFEWAAEFRQGQREHDDEMAHKSRQQTETERANRADEEQDAARLQHDRDTTLKQGSAFYREALALSKERKIPLAEAMAIMSRHHRTSGTDIEDPARMHGPTGEPIELKEGRLPLPPRGAAPAEIRKRLTGSGRTGR